MFLLFAFELIFQVFINIAECERIAQTVILPTPIGGGSGDFPHTCTYLYFISFTTKVVQETDADKYLLKENSLFLHEL